MARTPWAIEQAGSREHIEGTFGDDAPIWELNVLRAAAGDQGHRWELAEALLDAQSGEGQLG